MSIPKMKTEGGSGGKRGHSNMDHWYHTHEIKEATRRHRRIESSAAIQEQLDAITEAEESCCTAS